MNNKNSKVKKIVIAAMAVICAFSSATAITAGAKTTQYKHTVCVGGYPGGNDATWLSIKKNGTYTYDLFDGYTPRTTMRCASICAASCASRRAMAPA